MIIIIYRNRLLFHLFCESRMKQKSFFDSVLNEVEVLFILKFYVIEISNSLFNIFDLR
jgi:hypothetical protein